MKIDKKLKKLFEDNSSGSTELLLELHQHLKNEKKMLHVFPEIIELAKEQFKTFQNIQNYLTEMKNSLTKEKTLENFFTEYDSIFSNSMFQLIINAKNELSRYSKFVTHSNSKTIYEVLKNLQKEKPKIRVLICESRPVMEGRKLFTKLTKQNIMCELITEAMIYQAIKLADAVIIGADKILKNGDVINKTGSNLLALACNELNKPIYVICDKSKFSNSNYFEQKNIDPKIIWKKNPNQTLVKHNYFERINRNLFTKIISDL